MKLTREGKRFLIATVLIAVAAFNTANNLIYLVFSMMLSILFLSLCILKYNLNGLTLKVSHDQPIFAKSFSQINITLFNDKKNIPSYSINVMMPEKIKGRAYFPKILAFSEIQKQVPVFYERRGIYRYHSFLMESSFPFIFFSKIVPSRFEGEIIVYPEITRIDRIIPEMVNEWYESSQASMRREEEFSMIREFRHGDDWRRIHWKASAKTAKFMVKEYTACEPKKLTIILDNLKSYDVESFEKAVSFAASITDRFLNEGFFVRLLTCRKMIPFGSGKDHLFKILDILAVIEGQDSWECPFPGETEGAIILILNSEGSPLNRFITNTDAVIYASSL